MLVDVFGFLRLERLEGHIAAGFVMHPLALDGCQPYRVFNSPFRNDTTQQIRFFLKDI